MTRSQRLQPLLRVKQQNQDEAARELASREQALAEQQSRLEALRQYADEYALVGDGSVTNPALLANRLAFRARLDQAIVQQSRAVDTSREHSEVERARLMLASRETHVLEKLSASYHADEVRAAEQRTQRELDDLGARRRVAAGQDPSP
ncbi:flagellar export protein FliJ [Lysobacter sp. GX 14042]|uniref:flagellar export protein FliJ n=1 Tax=Lysobacter sp. GX 14042 TaxID=2907155 RepID=UPI001F22F66C|nr:flagellar export protein FliJ [Lysobacter sp. GX 14042]MCE7033352.1 flagellar export protein FliJ [Lysobacter sp. GX 14042]